MLFSLGFLVSTLLALLIIPALNERADRLSRRRVEAQLPMSIAELNAERDRLRAELAVRERQMEQRVEKALAGKAADMAELGSRAMRIDRLETELDAARKRIAGLEADLAQTRAELSETRADLEATRTALGETRATLAAREASLADLDARHNKALADLEERRMRIADLEERLAAQTERAERAETLAAERADELSAERADLDRTRKALSDEQARGRLLEERANLFGQQRDAYGTRAANLDIALREMTQAREGLLEEVARRDNDIERLGKQIAGLEGRLASAREDAVRRAAGHEQDLREMRSALDDLRAERASLQGALALARDERARVQGELAALRKHADTRFVEENAALIARIDEVTDAIMGKKPPAAAATGNRGEGDGADGAAVSGEGDKEANGAATGKPRTRSGASLAKARAQPASKPAEAKTVPGSDEARAAQSSSPEPRSPRP